MTANPILAETLRGDLIELRHRGAYAVAHANGDVIEAAGDIDRVIYPRSTYKIMQALPLVESGAADKYGLEARHLALACASHSGELAHLSLLTPWLEAIGLTPADLQCGVHPPLHRPSAATMAATGEIPDARCHQCSGKHVGFLTTTTHLGGAAAAYLEPDAPAQAAAHEAIAELCGVDAPLTYGVDGCAAPNFAVPLIALARGAAKLAAPEAALRGVRRTSAAYLRDAMAAHPQLIAGTGRFDTDVMAAAPGLIVKSGADGKHIAMIPSLGLGAALALDDGSNPAAAVAMAAILTRLSAPDAMTSGLKCKMVQTARNWRGDPIGQIRPGAAFT